MMIMKKIILGFALGVLSICSVSAQQLNANQKKLKADIFNYLKKEVSNLSDYSATDLRFTFNETTYFVSISESDYSPMYVVLYAGFNLPDTYKKDIVALTAPSLNSYKGVKFYYGDDYVKLQAEMFMNDYKPFAVSFHSLISVMGAIRDAFDDAYEKSKTNNYTISSSFTSQFKKNSNEYYWPYCRSWGDSKLYISKVSLLKDYTVLEMISYNGGQYQNCTIDRNSYLSVNGTKYSLQKAEGITYNPQYTDYPGYQSGREVSLTFKLYFKPLPLGTNQFDFSESTSGGWKITGITLEDTPSISLNGEIVTSDHKWNCVSIQCQEKQTVIKKIVTPTTRGTYMCSNQGEFIEDADTGRKYYLRTSSIGFEGNPTISHDNNPIEFYEVYPALPASVKRINISSGSQYYVKGVSIR